MSLNKPIQWLKGLWHYHYSDVKWAPWRKKSPATCLFRSFIKVTPNLCNVGHLERGTTSGRWIPNTWGQWCRKMYAYHDVIMTPTGSNGQHHIVIGDSCVRGVGGLAHVLQNRRLSGILMGDQMPISDFEFWFQAIRKNDHYFVNQVQHHMHVIFITLRWRHNGCNSVSNHQPHDCLLNRLFRRRSKKTSKFRVPGFCAGNSPVTGEFPAQMARNAENISMWWRLHDIPLLLTEISVGIRTWIWNCFHLNSGT